MKYAAAATTAITIIIIMAIARVEIAFMFIRYNFYFKKITQVKISTLKV
jgi:hypothetical protein